MIKQAWHASGLGTGIILTTNFQKKNSVLLIYNNHLAIIDKVTGLFPEASALDCFLNGKFCGNIFHWRFSDLIKKTDINRLYRE